MNTLLKKLNFKAQESILVLNAPDEFQEMKTEFSQFLGVKTDFDSSVIPFSLIFCSKLAEIEDLGSKVAKNLELDGLFCISQKELKEIYLRV
jgi:hypothetical protein